MKKNHRIYTVLCAGVLLTTPILTAVSGVQAATTFQAESSQVVSSSAVSASSVESSQSQSSSQTSSVAPTQSLQPTTEADKPEINSAEKVQVAPKAALNMDYQKAISAAIDHITSTNGSGPWQALAFKQSGISMTDAQRQSFIKTIGNDVDQMAAEGRYSATDAERSVIGLTALGEDPTNFHGVNLIQKTIEASTAKYVGINGQIYGIIALSTKDYGEEANKTITTLIQAVLQKQNVDKGWALFGTDSDVDITGMAMTALGMHRDVTGVQPALDKAVSMLKDKAFQKATGGFFIPSSFSKVENSNSISQAVMGLMAAGVDPAKAFVGDNGVNPISRLLAYQRTDGEFRWQFDNDSGALAMATEQATYALDQYEFFLNGKGSIYNFGGSTTTDPTDPVDPTNPTNPVDPTNPTNPVDPTDPTVPTDENSLSVQKSLDLSKTAVKSLVESEIDDENFLGSDIIFGAGRTGQLSRTQIKQLNDKLIEQSKAGNITKPNDLARVILNLQAMGIDPTNFDGRNLANELYESKTATNMGSYMDATILLALVSGHYQAPKDAKFTVSDLVASLVKDGQNMGNDGWGYEKDGVKTKDVDTTAVGMLALKTALLANDTYQLNDILVSQANTLLTNAQEFIESSATLDGGYGINGFSPSNTNSTAMGLAALATNGVDTTKVLEYKKGSALSSLLSFQNEDGSFKTDYSVSLATGQALLGLKAYQEYVAKKGSLYDFVKNPVNKYVEYADVTVQAVDQDGKVLKTTTVANQEVGKKITVKADQVAVDGYDLKDDATKDVTVGKKGTIVKFIYNKHVAPIVQYADVTVQAIDQDGKVLKSVTVKHQEVGKKITVKAGQVAVNGYDLKDEATKDITVEKAGKTVKFAYAKHTTVVTPTTEYADVTVQAVDPMGKVLKIVKMSHQEVGQIITVKASQLLVSGYDLKDDATKTLTVAKDGSTISFKYVKQAILDGDQDSSDTKTPSSNDRTSNGTGEDNAETTLPQTGVKTALMSITVGLVMVISALGVWFKKSTKKA
ncbi:MucBP domain-containing protein [Latilactobacillus curvatus]|uniref:MucBP domain-containing protein n=1 Tax=Latilactobacillus curvatus TaxID=28038 RepID=UPI0039AFC6AC